MTPRTPRLFDVEKGELKALPREHYKLHYRLTKASGPAKYTDYKPQRPDPCGSCFLLQHEGHEIVRGSARKKRTHPVSGEFIILCRDHVESWLERDRRDLGLKR